MKGLFYPRLAWTGIKNNRRLYLPYILTAVGVSAVFYIMEYLIHSGCLQAIRGGTTLSTVLAFGSIVIAVFAVIFLFYTNSFLIRRRRREFGLYNILGMDKKNIARVLLSETVIVGAVAIAGGLVLGIALSKLCELGLVNIVEADIKYGFSVPVKSVLSTVGLFAGIFLLIYLYSLLKVSVSNPIEMLKSESTGEKPPKANWLLGIAGIVILAGAYFIALSIKDPIAAMAWFFIAVLMVILATYLIFISGSVLLCRILQRNKKYYYNKKHFVSVSSMVYRMKRNGAGLASVCILATMVLVMISSTSCLYFGKEDSLNTMYPYDFTVSVSYGDSVTDEDIESIRSAIDGFMNEHGGITRSASARTFTVTGIMRDGYIDTDIGSEQDPIYAAEHTVSVSFIPLADYNEICGREVKLGDGKAMVFSRNGSYDHDTVKVGSAREYRVVDAGGEFDLDIEYNLMTVGTLNIVVPDFDAVADELNAVGGSDEKPQQNRGWEYRFDSPLSNAEQEEIFSGLVDVIDRSSVGSYGFGSKASAASDFYSTYGGLFFLGIMLSIVFICAAVLIIYYKQVCEGYEDVSRYTIMRKVGMANEDIKKSVSSQMLTVFFAPLLFAVLHLSFAFPMIRRLLLLFSLTNTALLLSTAAVSAAAFALLYVLVYRSTSNAYYSIVSSGSN